MGDGILAGDAKGILRERDESPRETLAPGVPPDKVEVKKCKFLSIHHI